MSENHILARYREAHRLARAARERDLAYAIHAKQRLDPDYWKAAYMTREKLRFARALIEELSNG